MSRVGRLVVLFPLLALLSCDWLPGPMGPTAASGSMNCGSRLVREYPSPRGTNKAALYDNVCNTGRLSSFVQVDGQEPEINRMVFTTFQTKPEAKWDSLAEFKVEWKSESELWVVYPNSETAQCNAHEQKEVTVHCVDADIAAKLAASKS